MFKKLLLGLIIMTNLNANTNRLIDEDSPYLLQHAHNPVNWYPWGDEAFKKAKRENKLIFLSIGYSTCHWCHVMERESFENESVAKILNRYFVSIKVDREEYPHIDRHYQDIFVLMNRRSGGWPLTIVMTPDKRVFFSATYLPSEDRYNQMGLKSILKILHDSYVDRRDEVLKSAASIEAILKRRESDSSYQKANLDIKVADEYVKSISSQFDRKNGGIGSSPKFPHATTFDTLLDIYRINGDKEALKMAKDALMAMSMGGIYDQIEGGFYRYSVDEEWMIPHFEKMLYTNAELIEAYTNGYAVTKESRFKIVVEETIQNINERFKKDSLFFSASDADSDGKEGKYFLFEYKDSLKALIDGGFSKSDAERILEYFHISKSGNFEEKLSNPYLKLLDKPKNLKRAKEILRANREKKNYPFIDHKVQTSWNGLYLLALFKASKHIDKKYAQDALESLDRVVDKLYLNGELYHQLIIGKKPKVKGYLEDYAFLIAASLEAYEVGFDEKYLNLAKTLMERAVMKFYKNGIWYMSDDDFKAKAEFYDASYRSALAVMIEDMLKIAILTDNDKLDRFAKESLDRYLADIKATPYQYPYGLKVYLQALLSNVVIKSTKENLLKNRQILAEVNYPYITLKPTKDKNFSACKIDSCFAVDSELSVVLDKLKLLK